MPPRTRTPRFTTGSRICHLCWRSQPPGKDMFIILGMGDDPLLVCQLCGDKVLELRPDGQPKEPEVLESETPQLSIFDQIK